MEWFTSLGWFWKFWIISSVVSLLIGEISTRAILAEMKRDYEITDKKSSISESVRARFSYLIPFYNVLQSLMWIFMYNTCYEKGVEESLKKGYIWKKKEREIEKNG